MKYSTGLKSNYVAKASLFNSPLGWMFKATGGIPVERSKSNNLVDALVSTFNKREGFVMTIAPEGTRKKVNQWKTGFYHIAAKAKIPVVRVIFDFSKKQVVILEPFDVSGEIDKDMIELREPYQGIIGKIEKYS